VRIKICNYGGKAVVYKDDDVVLDGDGVVVVEDVGD
jgi:hypothetical protein